MVRPGDVAQQCSLNQAVPHPAWFWECAPQHHPTATLLGCGVLQALTLLSLPMPPLSSLLPAGPTAICSCSNIPIPPLLPIFAPQCAWNPLAIMPKAHLWLCPLDPCAHLCCYSGNNLWVGCRAVFPSLSRVLLLGKQPRHKKPRAVLCSACVHPSGCAGGNYSITGSFRNAIFY